jgi:hypothetical protein
MWSFEIIYKKTQEHDMLLGRDFEQACRDAGLDPDMIRKECWIYSSYED